MAELYTAAHRLPEVKVDEFFRVPEAFRLGHEEWRRKWQSLGDLLEDARYYWAYFDPTEPRDSREEPVTGDLADDLTDVYLEVKSGLRAWDSGVDEYVAEVVWDWKGIGFVSHWGRHAVDAMRALHPLVFERGMNTGEHHW